MKYSGISHITPILATDFEHRLGNLTEAIDLDGPTILGRNIPPLFIGGGWNEKIISG